MLRAAVVFFVIGLLAYILGAYNIAGLSVELGKILLIVFIALGVVSFISTMIFGKNSKRIG